MIKELEIHLNTYDTITVDWKNVVRLKMTDVNKSYQFAGDFILEQAVANNVVLDILKGGNLPHKDFDTGKETTVFKRLIDCRDIVSLTIVYDDGKEEKFSVLYNQDEHNGFCNLLQSAEIDSYGSLIIKIGKNLC
jgi:hypothetical protein